MNEKMSFLNVTLKYANAYDVKKMPYCALISEITFKHDYLVFNVASLL